MRVAPLILSMLLMFIIGLTLNASETHGFVWLGSQNVAYAGSTNMVYLFQRNPYGEIWVKIFYYKDTGSQAPNSRIFLAIAHVVVVPGTVSYSSSYRTDLIESFFYIDTPARSPNRQVILDRGPGNGWPIYYCQSLGYRDDRAFVDLNIMSTDPNIPPTYITYCYYAPAGVDIKDSSGSTYIWYPHDLDIWGTVSSNTYPSDPGYIVETWNYINGKWWIYIDCYVRAEFTEVIYWWTGNTYNTQWIYASMDFSY